MPKTGADGFSYQKFNRRAQDWAIVGAVAVRVAATTRVGLVNMGATPLRARAWRRRSPAARRRPTAAEAAAEDTEASSDVNAAVEYREHLARVLTRRALEAIS